MSAAIRQLLRGAQSSLPRVLEQSLQANHFRSHLGRAGLFEPLTAVPAASAAAAAMMMSAIAPTAKLLAASGATAGGSCTACHCGPTRSYSAFSSSHATHAKYIAAQLEATAVNSQGSQHWTAGMRAAYGMSHCIGRDGMRCSQRVALDTATSSRRHWWGLKVLGPACDKPCIKARERTTLNFPARQRRGSLFVSSPSSLSSSSAASSAASERMVCTAASRNLSTEAAVANGAALELEEQENPSSSSSSSSSSSYSASQIQVLEGLDPVRLRPGMYIGSTGPRGLHHLIYEIVDNAIDEAQAGHATLISVLLGEEGSVTVTDNGRGIPTDTHGSTGKSALETVLTVLHAGGKFGGESSGYRVSGGLHGVGVSVVNALSIRLEAVVWRGGFEFRQRFERGKAASAMTREKLPAEERGRSGTQISFLPDPSIFTTTTSFDFGTVSTRLRELAFLNPNVTIDLTQAASDPDSCRSAQFRFEGGLKEYVAWLTRDKEPMHDIIFFEVESEGMTVSAALQWCSDAFSDTILGYANSIRTSDGGTHVDGLRSGVTKSFNNAARKLKLLREKEENLLGEHVREGLTCVIAVRVPNPEFEGQTKTRLGNPGVRRLVDATVLAALTEFFSQNSEACEAILAKAIQAFKAAEAAKKARDMVRRKSVLRTALLPGKLADCSSTDASKCEIFIVEGDSAGGSTKQARDRTFQAVLPLRGKILNVERKDDAAIYKNQELQNLILALGLGLRGEEFDERTLRYHRIILLTDADVDGAHIRTLLLTFLFRYKKELFERGHIFIGVAPLYKVDVGRKSLYCYDENELSSFLHSLPESASPTIQRFKGLGEMMPAQLWDTTLDPGTRRLKRVSIEDAAEAEMMLSLLMGDKVGPRKDLIQSAGSKMSMAVLDV